MIFGKNFSKILVVFLVLFFIGQMVATFYSVYWRWPWFDNLMHFLGGAFIAMAMIWWSSKRIPLNFLPPVYTAIVILGFVALVGVVWEFYELAVDRLITKNNYIQLLEQGGLLDTLKDLLVDLLGGLTISLKFLYERKKRQ
ncbi:MAG: hypothetical protein L6Q29_01400 [Candidatus Pacebacteria bacterium]|nr:hypothetical protein [Candidatus Paceibacterota bacterium]NUQ57234.1 hypothetical protein [Candidatus Paceibacter sp.]